ncbi:Crp/Fnr family transcriptional regulator [Sphingopyxis panaciterrae]
MIQTIPLTAFVEKLARHRALDARNRKALFDLPHVVKTVRRHDYLIREDEQAQNCCVILSGFAVRHKATRSGARQIFSIHMAGDGVDLNNSQLGRADHNIQMLSAGEVAFIPVDAIRAVTFAWPATCQAMWYDALLDGAIFREWTLNVGRRDAISRMAHMLCEFALRLQEAGLGAQEGYELPMTQEELADALGLTTIHVNRTLKALAKEKLIVRTSRSVAICDWARLAIIGDFYSGYLHLERPVQALSTP